MKNLFYASRPRKQYGSKEDVLFISCLNSLKNGNVEVLIEGHDFKYIPALNLKCKIEKIVSKVDKVIVLHNDGAIDQNQYLEVGIALTHNIPVLAMNINGRVIKKAVGFLKYYQSAIHKKVILDLVDITPN